MDLPQSVSGGKVTVPAPSTVDLDPGAPGDQTDAAATVVVEVPGFYDQTLGFTYSVFTRSVGIDNVSPTLANVAPIDETVGRPGGFTFTAEVTDADSSFTGELELLNTGSGGSITLSILGAAIPKDAISWAGISGGWRLEYILPLGADGVASPVAWSLAAQDRAGNTTNVARQLTVDGENPTLVSAVTGHWWNDAEAPGARLKTGSDGRRTSLRVTFSDTSGLEQAGLAPRLLRGRRRSGCGAAHRPDQ